MNENVIQKDRLKCAVVGVGYLGKFHAQKYASMNDVELVGISDINEEVGQQIAQELGCPYYKDYKDLLGKCDMVSVVVPSFKHYEVGMAFLKNGVHCLIEKPFATTLTQAQELKKVADNNSLMLSVGHLERFNPVFQKMQKMCPAPQYITSERLTTVTNRSLDINVVLDLMIHDLDLVLQLVDSPIKDVHCLGVPIISKYTDVANSYILFENGSVANISVSRISNNSSRKMRIFAKELYFSANLQDKSYIIGRNLGQGKIDENRGDFATENVDTLQMEIRDCVDAVKHNRSPLITAASALQTLEIALTISGKLKDTFDD
ncbi:MAG: Gfo/Idh/MocA family oxidoreductase [Gammaproteobacteria bacterium]|nr:Gfo/Idh/MocA family oxidoreductase [Gammaproteobacteria bacterium]